MYNFNDEKSIHLHDVTLKKCHNVRYLLCYDSSLNIPGILIMQFWLRQRTIVKGCARALCKS